MQVLHTMAECQKALNELRHTGYSPSVGFVPTMGNLHVGHLHLVEMAKNQSQKVFVSIFVNPIQFQTSQDYEFYPRTLKEDQAQLKKLGVDYLFNPSESTIYPEPQTYFIEPTSHIGILEDQYRPGHMRGVATVVLKLLNIIQPNSLFLGKKDYQQWRMLESLVRQLALPIAVLSGETIRAADGLALSSRNQFLNTKERKEAPFLYASLQKLAKTLQKKEILSDPLELCHNLKIELSKRSWLVDYVSLVNRYSLKAPQEGDKELVLLAAAYLGKTRLIDNLEILII